MLAIRLVKMPGMGDMTPVTFPGFGLLFVASHANFVAAQHAHNHMTVRHNMTRSIANSCLFVDPITFRHTLRPKACASSCRNILHMTRW